MNIKTKCLTDEQFDEIIRILQKGEYNIKPNKEMAVILTVTGNCGLRIGDCLKLKLDSFIKEGDNYKFNIKEQKTGKIRSVIIPCPVYKIIKGYAKEKGVKDNEVIFDYTVRAIQKKIKQIREYLGEDYKNVSTHSFRKCAGMRIYRNSGNDIELTRKFMNHSTVNVTQRYLGVNDDEVNKVIMQSIRIPSEVQK